MNQRDSIYSTTSDIVSPVDEKPTNAPRHMHEPSQTSVSPLSSQTTFHGNDSDSSVVSQIDLSLSTPTNPDKTFRSQIPRKPHQKSPDDNIKKRWNLRKEGNEETRWDEYSGEPNQTGKPSSARPGVVPAADPQPYPQLKERTRQILAGLKDREAVKKSGWGKVPPPVAADPLDDPPQRPPWRGASGRQAIVEPVKNTPEARVKPLTLVERHRKPEREARSPIPEEASQPEQTPRSPINSLSVAASHLPTVRSVDSEESLRPVAPLKSRKLSQSISPPALSPKQMEYAQLHLDSPFQSPGLPPPIMMDRVQSPATSIIPDDGCDSPTLGSAAPSFVDPERSSSEDSRDTALRDPPLQREVDTGASWKTYESSTVDNSNQYPPPSPIVQDQLTSSPISISHPWNTTDPMPIILRKRVAANNSGQRSYDNYGIPSPFSNTAARKSSANVLRKAVGVDSGSHDRNGKRRSVSLMSQTSTTKALPPTPGELQACEAADKAGSLEARLDDLARRKRNNNKIIYELHESLKKNAIIYDARKRKEVEKMITNLHLEVQDIKNEEHDVQLKLHRVQKRRDKDDFYEQPTGLWIKRVTT